MSIDQATVRRVAQLARITLQDDEVPHLQGEINAVLSFVLPMKLKRRTDEITDGGIADRIVANAPASEDRFFAVPKVIE